MLIYNYQKEFVGIDEDDLKALGFSDLLQLRNEAADFADLFVKTPGFVHNFKHVHWIDFITCAEGSEDAKVIIHIKGQNFRATIDIETVYLVDNPSQKAYLINLINLRLLTNNENERVSSDVLEKSVPKVSTENSAIFKVADSEPIIHEDRTIEQEQLEVTPDPYEKEDIDNFDELNTSPNVIKDIYEDAPIDLGDDLLEIGEPEEVLSEVDENRDIEIEEVQGIKSTPVVTQSLNVGSDYKYDPQLASDELGLPLDLIEEFIEDFISQAIEFKERLYVSLAEGNMNDLKILSHKLKGVAANLRVEDAFEVLTTINISTDIEVIKINLDTLYVIIAQLSGKSLDSAEEEVPSNKNEEDTEDDDLVLSFKDDFIEDSPTEEKIENSDIPQKIEMPELADDDFLAIDVDSTAPEKLDEDIELDELKEFISKEIELDTEEEPEEELSLIEELEIDDEVIEEDSKPLYDKTLIANEIGIDTQSFNDLFKDFIKESDSICDEFNESIEQNDSVAWRKTAIKLKGMSDNMRVHDFTTELESIIQTKDSNVAKEAVNIINTKLKKISGMEA